MAEAMNISSTSGDFDDIIKDRHTVSEQLKVKQWVTNHKQQLESSLATRQDQADQCRDIEILAENIEKLNSKLVDVSSTASLKELILQMCQVGQVLLEGLFPEQGETRGGDTQRDEDRKQPDEDLVKLSSRQAELSSLILGHHRKVQETNPELDKLKIERRDLMVKSRELVHEIRTCQDMQKNSQYESLSDKRIKRNKEKLDDELNKVTVQRNILQSLILGSGINWAKDPEMKELVFSLGAPLSNIIDNHS